jgi:hypothetical protein
MARVSEEFYCNKCDGYFVVRINVALDYEIELVCPNCGRAHRRCVKNGHIFEEGRYTSKEAKERILTTKNNYSKEPITDKMKKKGSRNGEPIAQMLLQERWASMAQREQGAAD